MTTPNPRLDELLAAATEVIEKGASAARRVRLRDALLAVPPDIAGASILRPLRPTPAVMALMERAVQLANASNDFHLRLDHIEFSLNENRNQHQQ